MWNQPLLSALLLVLAGMIVWWVLNRVLLSLEGRRLERVQGRTTFEAVPTETPINEPKQVAQTRATESIQLHLRNTRKLLGPIVILLVLFAVALPYLSLVPATFLSVVLSAGTVLVGIAAKPPVENFIAGLVMGFSRVLNIGDTVVYGEHYATVEDISMTHTILKIWDWRRLVIPNSKILSSEFENYSLTDLYIWAHVEFWVSYEADIAQVQELATAAAKTSEYFLGHEVPGFWVMETAKEGVRCWVAAWASNPSDGWYLKADIRTSLIKSFQEHGIGTHGFHITNDALPGPAGKPQAQG